MITYYFNIKIFGTELLIDEILKKLGNKIKIEYIIHPNDKKPKRDEKYGFGCISLSHPKVYIADDELVDYLSWLSDFIKEYFDIFYTLGMEEVWFYTNIYYTDSFLSLDLFGNDFLKQIASYKISISIPMDIYKETEQEIIEMLRNRP